MAKNECGFGIFLGTLQITNANLGYFSDFKKCEQNLEQVCVHLHTLNFLLGKSNLKSAIKTLFSMNKECFSVLNLLIAVRDKNIKILTANSEIVTLKSYFENPQKIWEFFCQTGLREIFQNGKIKNLHDFVFGVEVGLDSNARKNRGGVAFANLIAEIFTRENLNFRREVSSENFQDLNLGVDKKVFDFVIFGAKIWFIETNFYNVGGSKLNEVARSYTEISAKIGDNEKFGFVWITDGQGWHSAENKLAQAYKSVEIYNLSNLKNFIKRVKNG